MSHTCISMYVCMYVYIYMYIYIYIYINVYMSQTVVIQGSFAQSNKKYININYINRYINIALQFYFAIYESDRCNVLKC